MVLDFFWLPPNLEPIEHYSRNKSSILMHRPSPHCAAQLVNARRWRSCVSVREGGRDSGLAMGWDEAVSKARIGYIRCFSLVQVRVIRGLHTHLGSRLMSDLHCGGGGRDNSSQVCRCGPVAASQAKDQQGQEIVFSQPCISLLADVGSSQAESDTRTWAVMDSDHPPSSNCAGSSVSLPLSLSPGSARRRRRRRPVNRSRIALFHGILRSRKQ